MLAEIVDFIGSIVGLVSSMVSSLLQFFVMIPQWLGMLGTSVALIPGILFPFAMLGIFITLLLLIMGRN